MNKQDKIYVAGHNGMVGSAIVRHLRSLGFTNLLLASSAELDLRNQAAVQHFLNRTDLTLYTLLQLKLGVSKRTIFIGQNLYTTILRLS